MFCYKLTYENNYGDPNKRVVVVVIRGRRGAHLPDIKRGEDKRGWTHSPMNNCIHVHCMGLQMMTYFNTSSYKEYSMKNQEVHGDS